MAKRAVEIALKSKGQKPGRRGNPAPFVPSEAHLAWYHEWAVNHRRIVDIAKSVKATKQSVHSAVHKVAEWMRLEVFDDILGFRHRQTESLEAAAAETLRKWNETWDVKYLTEFRNLLADIRKIWGVDRPQKLQLTTETEGLERVAGIPRADALRNQAAALLAAATAAEQPVTTA